MDYYSDLASNLRCRFGIIRDAELKRNPAEQLSRLKANSEELDRLKAELPTDADPMLVHFLQRMSLAKALEFLQDNHLA